MDIERRDYPEVTKPAGAFRHSVRWGNLLFVSGFTAGGTQAETGDMAAQTDAVLQKLQRVLEANGATFENVVKLTSFVTDLKELPRITEVRQRYFSEDAYPAATQLEVSALRTPDLKIEIEAIAVLPD